MARRSTSSSATAGNGHIPAPVAVMQEQEDDSDSELGISSAKVPPASAPVEPLAYDPSLLPRGSRSLTSIATQSFWLGFTLSLCLLMTGYFTLANSHAIWRLPAFFGCLSLFHFLEFYTTARFNLPAARASSFLLFNNGAAYNTAHALATLEITLSTFVLPKQYQDFLVYRPYTICLGLVLIALGQAVRSVAMAQAGTNFNHTPVQTRQDGHELVTHGVYRWLRHPSYFGFFWWALGTQILAGNKVCFVGYTVILWRFFYRRIIGEEWLLVGFFGKDYEEYRDRTRTGIPFVK